MHLLLVSSDSWITHLRKIKKMNKESLPKETRSLLKASTQDGFEDIAEDSDG